MAAEKVLPKQLEYLTELSDEAKEAMKIPADAEIVNITDNFRNGGPIVISYSRPRSAAEKATIHKRIERAANDMWDDILSRMKTEPGLLQKIMNNLGMSAEEQKDYIQKQKQLFPETIV